VRLASDEALATMTIWAEARSEPHDGRVAVAEVIRHRVAQHYQCEGTVVSCLLRPAAFSCWNTADPNRRAMLALDDMDLVVLACREAWRESASSHYVPGAVHYLNLDILGRLPPWLEACHEVATIGHQHFYALGPA
jgi:N-acetylmuramoyl-L-alanine amidase